jgi:hypothetical protein
MIIKLPICVEDKILFNNFLLEKTNNTFTLKVFNRNYENKIEKIKVPLCNNFEGISYIDLFFPYEIKIVDKKLICNNFLQKIFLSENDLEIDFFIILENYIFKEYQLDFLKKSDLIIYEYRIWKYWMEYEDHIEPTVNLNKKLWEVIQLYLNFSLFLIYRKPDFTIKTIHDYLKTNKLEKKVVNIANIIKTIKFSIFSSNEYCFNEHFLRQAKNKTKLSELKIGFKYFIKNLDGSKFFQVEITGITNNIIHTENNQAFIFENYEWFFYIIDIDFEIIMFNLIKNNKVYEDLFEKTNLKIEAIHGKKMLDYYLNNNECSLVYFRKFYPENYSDIEILKRDNYSNIFFNYITQKYSSREEIISVLTILFKNYTYPIKQNKCDNNFDHILYYSFYHSQKIFNEDKLDPAISEIIPVKLKTLYCNLINLFYQISIHDNFQFLITNQKFYTDYLHRTLIKIILYNNKLLTTTFILNKLSTVQITKIISIIKNTFLCIDISNRLTWNNLPKKLHYLQFLYDNKDILFISNNYGDKFNRNIIPEAYDVRLKKVIERPFDMFKFLRKEKDFVKWTRFISSSLNNLFYTPLSLSSEDLLHLGKILYLLVNVNEQNVKDESYLKLINYCQKHNKLILDNTRINMKIKENFPYLKININLGFLAKHLTFNYEGPILLEDDLETTQELMKMEENLRNVTKKYQKYKLKYSQSKKDTSTELPLSETSIKN